MQKTREFRKMYSECNSLFALGRSVTKRTGSITTVVPKTIIR
jgi:hypothetical protein